MSERLQQHGVTRVVFPLIALVVALLIGFSGVLPASQARAAAPVTRISDADCPVHDRKHDAARLGCMCILCALPVLAAAPGAHPLIIPPRLYAGAAHHFATGVSATHGPELTANLATGPPGA